MEEKIIEVPEYLFKLLWTKAANAAIQMNNYSDLEHLNLKDKIDLGNLDLNYAINLIPYIENADTEEEVDDFLTRPFLNNNEKKERYVAQMVKKYS